MSGGRGGHWWRLGWRYSLQCCPQMRVGVDFGVRWGYIAIRSKAVRGSGQRGGMGFRWLAPMMLAGYWLLVGQGGDRVVDGICPYCDSLVLLSPTRAPACRGATPKARKAVALYNSLTPEQAFGSVFVDNADGRRCRSGKGIGNPTGS